MQITPYLRPLALVFCSLASLTASAQLRLTQPTMNVGKLQWNVGKEIAIEVENAGTTPASVLRVNTDCACLVANAPTTPIAPGAKATVIVRHTAPLLGTFSKNIHIYTSTSTAPLQAHLTGQVLSEVDKELYTFTHRIGDIALTTSSIQFTDVSAGDTPQQVIYVQNNSNHTYEPQLMHLPPYLTATYQPTQIFRGRTGKVTLTLNSSALEQMGLTQGSIYLSRFAGDRVGSDNELAFSAVVHPTLTALTPEQIAQAPNLQLSTDTLLLPMPKPKAKLKGQVLLTNNGKTPLIIGNVQVFNPAINIRLKSSTVLPGQTLPLDIAIVTSLVAQSKQPLRLLIVTNDPHHPQRYIDVVVGQ